MTWRLENHQGELNTEYREIIYMYIQKTIEYYGCWQCGNCCKSTTMTKAEMHKIIAEKEKQGISLDTIAKNIHKTPNKAEFEDGTIVEYPKDLGEYQTKEPCFLLEKNKCTVYDMRPKMCKLFPFNLNTPMEGYIIVSICWYHLCPMATQIIDEYLDYAETRPRVEYKWLPRELIQCDDDLFNLNIEHFMDYCIEKGITDFDSNKKTIY